MVAFFLGLLPSLFSPSSILKVPPGQPGQEHWQLRLMGTQSLCSRGQGPYQPVALLLYKWGSQFCFGWEGKLLAKPVTMCREKWKRASQKVKARADLKMAWTWNAFLYTHCSARDRSFIGSRCLSTTLPNHSMATKLQRNMASSQKARIKNENENKTKK